jgi:hypothetical protein
MNTFQYKLCFMEFILKTDYILSLKFLLAQVCANNHLECQFGVVVILHTETDNIFCLIVNKVCFFTQEAKLKQQTDYDEIHRELE